MEKKIILFLVIVVVFFYFQKKSKSSFESKFVGNILVIACHIKKQYSTNIINNNLQMIGNVGINLIIVVYSTEQDVEFNKDVHTTVPIVYIHDTENKYYDFYKYKLAYNYIKKNDITFNWIFVTNDSIIISDNVSWMLPKIINSGKDYVGILEVKDTIFGNSIPAKQHYQSWWLNFKPNAFEYWMDNIKFDKSHLDVLNIINDYEVNLSNDMINKFNSTSLFPLTNNFIGNVFTDDEMYYDYFYNRNFKIVKVKFIKPELVPENLKSLFD
jgi:hypothetical protein